MKTARTRRKTKRASKLDEREWNFFDSKKVPGEELIACCLWEYARESALLRELREKCDHAWRAERSADSVIPLVAGNIKHSHDSVELFLREIVLQRPPDLRQSADPSKPFYWPSDAVFPPPTSGFPNSWQSQSTDERTRWAESVNLKMKPYIAFNRGRLRDAQAIVRTVMEQRKVALNPKVNPLTVSWIATHSPLIVDAPFEWTDREERLPGGFLYPDGTEVSVVEINWAKCTNKEIGEWLAKHRPASIPEPKDTGGHKHGDWRAMLERLGLLRLRRFHQSVEETIKTISQTLPLAQRKKAKFVEPGECNRQAAEAVANFHILFPFLDPAECRAPDR